MEFIHTEKIKVHEWTGYFKTEDWSMECEDSSASWEVGKFVGRNEKKQSGCYGNMRSEVGAKW